MSDLLNTARPLIEANAYANHTGVVVRDIQPDFAECTLEVTPETMNPFGSVHGGAFFTLADVAAGMAARTDGRGYVTQQASVQFLRAAKQGTITARARVLHRGGTVCLIEVRITAEADKLLFLSTFNFYCVRR